MLSMCQLNVKVTVKGQILNKQILKLCSVCSVSPTLMEKIFNLCSVAHVSVQGQGHH